MIERWPNSSALDCGCRVALKAEGPGDVVLYFPCRPQCPTVALTQMQCEQAGKKWERRNVHHN